MIHVDKVPSDCTCGWIKEMGPWRLSKPEPHCPHEDHHVKPALIQPSLEELPEWEVGP